MPFEALIFWAFVVAWVVVVDLVIVHAGRAVHEGKRIVERISALGTSPLFTSINEAQADVERLSRTLEVVPHLLERGSAALAKIPFLQKLVR